MADKWKKREVGSWTPQEIGDEVEGVLAAVETNVGQYDATLYTLTTPTGPVAVWGKTVLDNLMAGVAIGTEVKIVFTGVGEAKGGQSPAKLFDVFEAVDSGGGVSSPAGSPEPPAATGSSADDDLPF